MGKLDRYAQGMAEYKYVDLPLEKVDNKAIAGAITKDLNAFAAEGWRVLGVISSRVIGKVGYTLSR